MAKRPLPSTRVVPLAGDAVPVAAIVAIRPPSTTMSYGAEVVPRTVSMIEAPVITTVPAPAALVEGGEVCGTMPANASSVSGKQADHDGCMKAISYWRAVRNWLIHAA